MPVSCCFLLLVKLVVLYGKQSLCGHGEVGGETNPWNFKCLGENMGTTDKFHMFKIEMMSNLS